MPTAAIFSTSRIIPTLRRKKVLLICISLQEVVPADSGLRLGLLPAADSQLRQGQTLPEAGAS